ncbi:hypothetical protein PTI98_009674 [Pleurotus ostreatus]|nr:hypothetical protein PTI98_009674 [Pleurotus ostreatus]
MAPPEKVSADQKAFLENLVNDYLEVKKTGAWAKFWASTFQAWLKLWPEDEDAGIMEEGERKKALTDAIDERQQYIKTWFRNHALLELYSEQYYNTRVASKLIRSELDKAFRLEPPHIQEQIVEEHAKLLAESAAKRKHTAERQAPTPQSYNVGIDSISANFDIFEEQVAASGWSFVLLAGGPDPKNAGQISTVAGRNILGLTHSQYDPNFMRAHVPAFKRFLQTCYTPKDCEERALNKATTSGSNGTPSPESPAPSPSPVLVPPATTPLVNVRPTVKPTQREFGANVVAAVDVAQVNPMPGPPTVPFPIDPMVFPTEYGDVSDTADPTLWDGFNVAAALNTMDTRTDAGFIGYPSLTEELAAPLPSFLLPLASFPYSFSTNGSIAPGVVPDAPIANGLNTDTLIVSNTPITNTPIVPPPAPNGPPTVPVAGIQAPASRKAGAKARGNRKASTKARVSKKQTGTVNDNPPSLSPTTPLPTTIPPSLLPTTSPTSSLSPTTPLPTTIPPSLLPTTQTTIPPFAVAHDEPDELPVANDANDNPPFAVAHDEPDELPVANDANDNPPLAVVNDALANNNPPFAVAHDKPDTLPVANDANDTPTVPLISTKARASQKRPRNDGLEPALIVSTKRLRKTQTRTEIEALTDKIPPKIKENRRPRPRR